MSKRIKSILYTAKSGSALLWSMAFLMGVTMVLQVMHKAYTFIQILQHTHQRYHKHCEQVRSIAHYCCYCYAYLYRDKEEKGGIVEIEGMLPYQWKALLTPFTGTAHYYVELCIQFSDQNTVHTRFMLKKVKSAYEVAGYSYGLLLY